MLKRWAAWPPGIRWLVGIAVVVLAVAIVWALFVPVPTWLARYDVGSAKPALVQTARDAARGRLLTLGAGLLAAGALVFTARNFRTCLAPSGVPVAVVNTRPVSCHRDPAASRSAA
jgi:hypothetical protein